MTSKQFANLWVGSIVHRGRWPWRVRAIDRTTGHLRLAKLPESVYPEEIEPGVRYQDCAYVPTQKPPQGYHLWEEEDRA